MSIPFKEFASSRTVPAIGGTLVVAALAVLFGVFFYRHFAVALDPLEEADRRIGELEDSLEKLQNTIERAQLS